MVSIEEVLDLMDENRAELDRRVGRICANPDINEERRRQLLARPPGVPESARASLRTREH